MEGSVCKSDIQAAQRDAKRQNKMKFFTDLKKKGERFRVLGFRV